MKLAHWISLLSLAAVSACTAKDDGRTVGDSMTVLTTVPDVRRAPASTREPTANDISNYKLDMEKMQKYAKALKGFATLAKTDSAAAEAMASNSNGSTAQMIAKLEASPAAMSVLRDAGLTAKDYVWITAAWIQAAMTQTMLEANKAAKLPEGQNPQNLEFLRANKAELEALTRDVGSR